MKKLYRSFSLQLSSFLLILLMGAVAHAAPVIVSPSPNSFGEIERITLNNPADVYSGGVMVVGGVEMIIPKNLLIDLPANRLSLQQIFDQAPAACKALGESGLAKVDRCNGTGSGGIATLSAVRTNAGNVIIGDLFIQKAAESVVGQVTYINYDQGYYRVNGLPNDPNTGSMVRLNDPTGRHTVQSGTGCAGGPNCSPDPRFTLDPDNYTNTFSTGYPVCIPSTVPRAFPGLPALTGIPAIPAGTAQAAANGTGDLLCPDSNRTNAAVEPPVNDSRLFAPVKVGDSVVAEGNYETINGVRFLSAHTSNIQKALQTKNVAGQPDYLFLEEVFIEAPAFQNQRQRAMWIGFTTLAPTDVDIWSIHRDPVDNALHEFPLASVQGCDIADLGSFPSGICSQQGIVGAGANIFKIRYDVDFILANNPPITPGGAVPRLNPCLQLQASPRFQVSNPGICPGGANQMFANNIGILGPVPHEIIARTGHKLDSPAGSLTTLDVKGGVATNGEYLFPLGMNLGGIEVAEMSEIDLNLLNTPPVFEAIPWNLDRRLSPSGCLNAGGCESLTTSPMGTFVLDPFPFTGLDPRTQADFNVILPGVGLQVGGLPTGSYNDPHFNNSANPLTNVRNRMFSFVDAALGKPNGDATVLPYALGIFPADPALIPINPTPALNFFAPITQNDTANTNIGVPVTIDVLANDIPVLGSILPSTVTVSTGPASGSITGIDFTNGKITYAPAAGFAGQVTFQYTVANNFLAVSLPATVTVNIFQPATGVTLSSFPLSPQTAGTDVAFVAAASGGTGTYEYQYWLHDGTTWSIARDYSAVEAWTWTTTGLTAKTYTIQVTARNVGSTASFEAFSVMTYTLGAAVAPPAPATGATIATSPASPQPAGTSVIFTAAGVGGSGTYEYEFWRHDGVSWTKVQSYTAVSTWVWNTTGAAAGAYTIQVNVRSAGSTAAFEGVATTGYTLSPAVVAPAPATGATITATPASPKPAGTQFVVFSATGAGGSGSYQFEFWLHNGVAWSKVQDYSSNANFAWDTTAVAAGTYTFQVNVRSAGSTAAFEAFSNIGYDIP